VTSFPARLTPTVKLAIRFSCFLFLASQGVGALPPIQLQPVVAPNTPGGLVAPVGLTHAGDGSGRMFVTDQRGQIRILQNGNLLAAPLIDLGSKLVPERAGFDERGLLGLAFHPDFGVAGARGADKFYVFYTAPQPNGNPTDPVNPVNSQSVIAEYSVHGIGSNTADLSSERILLAFDKPQFNHNGGYLGFGPDRQLYISTGDGGGGGDDDPGHTGGGPGNPTGGLGNSQDLTKLMGKMLRIDVDGANSPNGQYGIPADNPFVNQGATARPEIYAYGLRNPWRASFDDGPGGTGRLFVADVGQNAIEEINLLESGGNYGWRIREGSAPFDPTVVPNPPATLIGPIAEYAHPNVVNGLPQIGLSVTGGHVYRGADFPALQGIYVFGDWSSGFQSPSGTLLGLEETAPGSFQLSTFDVVGGNPIGRYIQVGGALCGDEADITGQRARSRDWTPFRWNFSGYGRARAEHTLDSGPRYRSQVPS
jgi:glucose/arabinose dehydrogenase